MSEDIKERHFKTGITLLIAGLTFLTSLIVFLNVRASNRAAAATRDGRILGIRYLSHIGRSLWDAASEKDLMNTYQEASGLMMQAQIYARMAKVGGDAAFYKMMEDAQAKSRSLLLAQGELAKPPYFNADFGAFDFFQYYLDRVFVPSAALKEREEQKWAENSFWSSKSDAYTAGLAVMAVAVFLLTLSLVIHAHVRVIIASVGGLMVAALLVLAGLTTLRVWHGRSEDSINLLARAQGNALSAQMVINLNGDIPTAAAYAGKAKTDIDRIIAAEGDYPTAILLRARIHGVQGEARFYAGEKETARTELDLAAADLEAAMRAGKADGFTHWSTGYNAFLRGRYDVSLSEMDRALVLLPRQKFTLGLVKAVTQIYAGKAGEARVLAEEAVDFALRTPLGADTMNLRTIIKNIERFNELRSAPGLPELIVRLKEASVCLAVLNKARPGEVKAEISAPRFVAPVTDAAGKIVETPPVEALVRDPQTRTSTAGTDPQSKPGAPSAAYKRGTGRASFMFELKGMEKGQSIVRKVYRRAPGQVFWIEQLWLSRAEHWEGPAEARLMGTVENRIPEAGEVLDSGDYRLEIYVEGALKAAGTFKVL